MSRWLVEAVHPITNASTLQAADGDTAEHAQAAVAAQGFVVGRVYPAPPMPAHSASVASLIVPGGYYRPWLTAILHLAGAVVIAAGAFVAARGGLAWAEAPRGMPDWPYFWQVVYGLSRMVGGTIYLGVAHIASTTHHAAQDIVRAIREGR